MYLVFVSNGLKCLMEREMMTVLGSVDEVTAAGVLMIVDVR